MVSHSLIVFCCICGAGVAVFIGWAVSHRFVKPVEAKEPAAGDFNQAQYMREVRLRHQGQLAGIMGGVGALGNVVLSPGILCDGREMVKARDETGDLCAGNV
ncbi:hypothetical protein KC345_g3794 [Hortaea werneckii]|nr:hypothetical protein KC345_g3794 [Hortaea werneckii]